MEENTSHIKIIITGPESTGKSTTCNALSEHFQATWVSEYARKYLENLNRPYTESDLVEIAKGQFEKENEVLKKESLRFIDTSFEVLKVWSEWKYQRCNSYIQQLFDQQVADLYLLMSPDIPWANDKLRENPNDRIQLFEIYKNLLHDSSKPFHIITGERQDRLSNAIRAVQSILDLEK